MLRQFTNNTTPVGGAEQAMKMRGGSRVSPVKLLGMLVVSAVLLSLVPEPQESAHFAQIDLPDAGANATLATQSKSLGDGTASGSGSNTSLGVAADVEVQAGDGVATFTFAAPLWETHPPTWRFRGPDGWAQDATIRVSLHDAHGRPLPTHDSSLTFEGPKRFELRPVHATLGEATFALPHERLAGPEEAHWRIAMQAQGTHWFGGATQLDATPIRWLDTDGDGTPQDIDLCPATPDDQTNTDGDLAGDACDMDDDNDGFPDTTEQEAGSDPKRRQSTPDDLDGDGAANQQEQAAGSDPRNPLSTPDDPDADGYTVASEQAAGSDNFNARSTPRDVDADGLPNEQDNCGRDANPDQRDGDADGIGDACDNAPEDGPQGDADGDGTPNSADKCPSTADDQRDADSDGYGDACDSDRDGDGALNVMDAFPDDPSETRDTDGDGQGDEADTDDDNDGLNDATERNLGSDLTKVDSDGDGLGDLFEHIDGTNLNDPTDPDPRAQELTLEATSTGLRLRWESGARTSHIEGYALWRTDNHGVSLVQRVRNDARALDGTASWQAMDALPQGDALYSVQPIVDGVTELRTEWVVSAAFWAEDLPASSQLEAAPETRQSQANNPSEPTVAPDDKDTPGLGAVAIVAAFGLASIATGNAKGQRPRP